MKKILIILSVLFCTTVFAHTIEWYVGDTLLSTTTCESGDNITPPTVPEKFGYHFKKWDGYMPIEYLESSGTQWIDTGVKGNQDTIITTRYQFTNNIDVHKNRLYGAGVSAVSKSMYYIVWENKIVTAFNNEISSSLSEDFNKHTLVQNKNVFILDGNIIQTHISSVFTTPYNLYLFAAYVGNVIYPGSEKIYSFKIEENSITIRDFIPVLDKNGTPCMFDKVEHKFYYNAGTGKFIAGPIVGSGE